ncbi:nucleoid-associated protein [Gilvimarinus algae]|uniref:Nucleoid-associated protein n=1 Tax=Gilvimarinus algae TaxID=3058037 RepID=A0ABT8TK30_9GAMM|nr:nucleoid-associated protein [Gilvimarinus sp. SDUM040014]MDO3383844.1 nucleoid-associated protein [Gilvimarinus sp. SDUM040014]
MQLINFSVDRIIIHQVFQRGPEGEKIKPLQSHDFTRFDNTAMDAFKSRVRDALGDGSKAVQMEIVDEDKNGMPAIVNEIVGKDDADFVVSSYDVAKKLTDAQKTRGIPGGIVVVFTGTHGAHKHKFLGVIKAEIYSAYEKLIDKKTNEISLKYVEEVLLTPGTKLYKTAGFFERVGSLSDSDGLNSKWSVLISDNQISQTDGKAAAMYFYSDFLGCGYPETSARTTKKFYDAASAFIKQMNVSAEKKIDLYNALTTYLKVNTSSVVSPQEFGSSYFDVDTQDEFIAHLSEKGLPPTSFTKDNAHIASKLKVRKVQFSKNVKIIAPSDVFKDLVSIETIEGDLDESGAPKVWTRILVKDLVVNQE